MTLPLGAIKQSLSSSEAMKVPFLIFQSHPNDYYQISQDTIKGIQQESILSRLFFHPRNIDLIQKQIIMEIFYRSDGEYLIQKQDERDLVVVMRSIFLQHAKHHRDHIKEQIRELNCLVVDEVVPGILTEIKAYLGYLERAFGPRQILDRPISTNSAGLKSLPSVTSIWKS